MNDEQKLVEMFDKIETYARIHQDGISFNDLILMTDLSRKGLHAALLLMRDLGVIRVGRDLYGEEVFKAVLS